MLRLSTGIWLVKKFFNAQSQVEKITPQDVTSPSPFPPRKFLRWFLILNLG